jgi:hypothetical protein
MRAIGLSAFVLESLLAAGRGAERGRVGRNDRADVTV